MNVVAAVIRKQGRILICQRKLGRHALKWEFPGGKIEPGEQPPEALARELREELNIEARIGPHLHAEVVQYPGRPLIHLDFFEVTDFSGEPQNLEFEQMLWEEPHNLLQYDFLEGDVPFLRILANQAPDSQ